MASPQVSCSLVLDELFVLVPRRRILINSFPSLCLSLHVSVSPSSPAATLHFSYRCFPITLAQTRRIVCLCLAHYFRSLSRALPPCISLLLLWLLSRSQVHVSIMTPRFCPQQFPLHCISLMVTQMTNLQMWWLRKCLPSGQSNQVINTDCIYPNKQKHNRWLHYTLYL